MLYTAPQAFSFCRFGWKRNSCKIILTLLWNSSLVIVRILLFFSSTKGNKTLNLEEGRAVFPSLLKDRYLGLFSIELYLLCCVWIVEWMSDSPFWRTVLPFWLFAWKCYCPVLWVFFCFLLTEVPSKVQEFCDFRMPQWGCSLGGGNHSHTVNSQSQCLISMHFNLGGWFFLYVCGNEEKKKEKNYIKWYKMLCCFW